MTEEGKVNLHIGARDSLCETVKGSGDSTVACALELAACRLILRKGQSMYMLSMSLDTLASLL